MKPWVLCAPLQQDSELIRSLQLFRDIAQPGSAPALGAGCREFESLYPDHLYLRWFLTQNLVFKKST